VEAMLNLAFNRFIPMYEKNYQSFDEYLARKSIFEENYKFIQGQESLAGLGVEVKVNHFADMRKTEYKTMLGLDIEEIPDDEKYVDLDRKVLDKLKQVAQRPGLGNITIGIDWREKGAVTDIK